jgi:hypothetical protein
MKRDSMCEKLARLQGEKGTDIGLILRPQLTRMPLPMQRYDDPFLPFGKAIIDATRDLICCVMFDLAAYMTLGAASVVALERTIAYAKADALTVLHASFGTRDFVSMMQETAFDLDAVTVTDVVIAEAYLAYPERGALVHVTPTDDPPRLGNVHNLGVWYDLPDDSHIALPLPNARGVNLQRVRLLSDAVVYAGRGDDFAQQTRSAIETHLK